MLGHPSIGPRRAVSCVLLLLSRLDKVKAGCFIFELLELLSSFRLVRNVYQYMYYQCKSMSSWSVKLLEPEHSVALKRVKDVVQDIITL